VNIGRNQRASTRKHRKQQHLLDVTVRSRKASQQRNRRIVAWFCSLILFAGIIGGAVYGARKGLQKFFWDNPDYNLAEIEIKTDGNLTREQIVDATGLREGVNIFSLNIAKTRDALVLMPQVEHAEVERVLPNKLTIEISERRPVAWIAAKYDEDPTVYAKSFLVDRKGVLIKTQNQLAEYLHLPVIYGVPTDNFDPGEIVDTPELKAALDLIRLSADNPERFQVRSIDLSKGYCMVVTDQRHAKITFGIEHVDTQIERLGVLLDRVEQSQREIQTVNLLVQRNVPVTFMAMPDPGAIVDEPDASPLPAPKPAVKPTPTPIAKKPAPLSKSTTVRKAEPVKSKTTHSSTKPVRKAIPVAAPAQNPTNG